MVKWFNTSYRRSVAETTAETRWYSVKKHILSYFGNIQWIKALLRCWLSSIMTNWMKDCHLNRLRNCIIRYPR
uniref:hypothetical protein n=1 Tax=Streptomyces atratus TaxID=1893 RepID=UPI0036D28C29